MKIWETNLTGKGARLCFPRWIQHTHMASSEDSTQGAPTFKVEMSQQKPQEEEIPIRTTSALKTSRKHLPRQHQPYNPPTWGQIKTLTNQVKNLASRQEMPQSPENLLIAKLAPLACVTPAQAKLTHWT